ncbi:hypothetical protein WN943_014099 [Citrus x changshan-huyou]
MADSVVSLEKVKAFWHSQVHDEEKWALNARVSCNNRRLMLRFRELLLDFGSITRQALPVLHDFPHFLVETAACWWPVCSVDFSDAQLW